MVTPARFAATVCVAAAPMVARAAAAWLGLLTVLAGLPIGLATVVGWPLPRQVPSGEQLLDLAGRTNLLTADSLINVGACLLWLLWAVLLASVVAHVVAAATRVRLPRLPLPGVMRRAITGLLGSLTVAAGHAPSAFTAPPPAAAQPAAPSPAGAPMPAARMVATTPAVAPPALAAPSVAADTPQWTSSAAAGYHRVVAGDTLWDIADRRLGNPRRWPQIYRLNEGRRQSDGHALRDPDLIHIGWTLALPKPPEPPSLPPPRHPGAPPHDERPAPPVRSPSPPPVPGPATASPAPGPATPAPTTTPHDDADPVDDARDGVDLPSDAWISLGLAAAITAAAALVRLHHRRHARLRFPIPLHAAAGAAPVPASLTAAESAGHRHLGVDPDRSLHGLLPAAPVRAPVGVDPHGVEVSVFDLAPMAVAGAGGEPVARAILAGVLATGVTEPANARPVVVTTTGFLHRLLPGRAPTAGLDPAGETFDGERLIVCADPQAALTRAEDEIVGRRRLLADHGAATIAELNARTDHLDHQPTHLVLVEADRRTNARLSAVARLGADLDVHTVAVGHRSGLPTLRAAFDGRVEESDLPGPAVSRLATLTVGDLADLLTLIAATAAGPITDAPTQTDEDLEPEAAAGPAPQEPHDLPPAGAAPPARLRVLGPITVTTAAGTVTAGIRTASYAVLALLAAHPHGRTLDQLTADLYPSTNPAAAVNRVRTAITSARRVLRTATGHPDAAFIGYDPATGRYRLTPTDVCVDLWDLHTAIRDANTAEDDADCLAALREAAAYYRGEFADGLDHSWAADHATTYRIQILNVYARIAEILEIDRPDEAIAALEHATRLDPVNEELYQRIIRIHGRLRRPDAVRRTLRLLEDRLADLAGAEPSETTRRIAHRQLHADR